MGDIKKHPPVKLIVGMIATDAEIFLSAENILSQKFGNMDFTSEIIDFNYTDYYKKEMGENLLRKFITFERLIKPEEIVEIKIYTNEIEEEFLREGTNNRKLNLDPGYITAAKLVLATTKDYIHRIYLRDGIYAEVTLEMKGNSFCPWKWTYRDYQTDKYIAIFNNIRQMYMSQLQELGISAHAIK
ncbi:TPA: DUF4416 family protein [bacterium]|jgi:hypothetical protein|nr:DUF4416 family protein [bacterium]